MGEADPLLRGTVRTYVDAPTSDQHGDIQIKDEGRCYVPRRYILSALLMLGTANCFTVRVNFNVALLAMTNQTQAENENNGTSIECPGNTDNQLNHTLNRNGNGEYDWSPGLQSQLLSAFYYGYAASQMASGLLADRFGARRLLIGAGLCGGVFNLLIPVTAEWNVYALIVLRVLLGIGMGPVWPAMASMIPVWTMVSERTRLYSIAQCGLFLGTVVSQSISGVLCDSEFLGGWPSAFYLFGVLSLLYGATFWYLTADTPAQHKTISRHERHMIESNCGETKSLGHMEIPFRKIITSRAVWVLFFMLFMDIFAYDIVFTYLPLYMKRVLKYDISASGGLASLPYITSMVTTCTSGILGDFIASRGWLSTMGIRRLFTAIGDLSPAVCVIIITLVNCDRMLVVFLFILLVTMEGFGNGGFGVNMFDIAPRYAGTVYGIINGLSNIGGFSGPLIVGAITHNSGNMAQWHKVFYMVAGFYTIGVLIFCIFGSAEVQPWAKQPLQGDCDRSALISDGQDADISHQSSHDQGPKPV